MLLSKAIEGYNFDKVTTYSKTTLEAYVFVFRHLIDCLGDKEISEVTSTDLKRFIFWLKTDYVPRRFSGDTSPLSPAAVDLHWKGVRSLFHWAHETLDIPRPDLEMPRPNFKRAHISPFSEDEIRRLLRACEFTVDKTRGNSERIYNARRPTAYRNKAIILTLLDTGLRLGELLRIQIRDVNFDTGEIMITPYSTGRKTTPRLVSLGDTARRMLWLYTAHLPTTHPSDRLFPMTPTAIRLMLIRLGRNSSVNDVHPHRFRHSFAIWYLRNGGDIFTLKKLLGHSTLEMVNYYLDIAQSDIALAHRRASPLDRWNATKAL